MKTENNLSTNENNSGGNACYMPKLFNGIIDDLLEEEGITKEDLEMVDLNVEYSPVIAIRGEGYEDAVEAIPCVSGKKYLVKHPLCPTAVDEETLKVMRYRFLINRPKLRFNFGI